jgi:hypothetical protein
MYVAINETGDTEQLFKAVHAFLKGCKFISLKVEDEDIFSFKILCKKQVDNWL